MDHQKSVEKSQFFGNFKYAGLFLLTIWVVAFLEIFFPNLKSELGVIPRTVQGVPGIIGMWLVHKDLPHLISNSSPLFLLTLATLMFYPEIAWKVFALCLISGGGLLWCFGREAIHIGASGLIYALASFLFFSGVFRRDRKSIAAALIVSLLYGSLVWGVFPIYKEISWDGHLFGAIGGGIVALYYRNHGRVPPEQATDDPIDQDSTYWRPDLPPEGHDDF